MNPFDEQNTEDAAGSSIEATNEKWKKDAQNQDWTKPLNPNDDKWYKYPVNPNPKKPKSKPVKPEKK